MNRPPHGIAEYEWENPHQAIISRLTQQSLQSLRINYRGLRRIEELRDLLKFDRILEPMGVLLDSRYFARDLKDALHRGADTAVSVIRIDMDGFKAVNEGHGHPAGDVVMREYLKTVQLTVGTFGEAYRAGGDEVAVLIVGQGHAKAIELGEQIRKNIAAIECSYKGTVLPSVTASIGVATTPPENRGMEIEDVADGRQLKAKKMGKNKVVST